MALAAPTMDFSGSPNAPVYAEQALGAKAAYDQALTTIAAKKGQLNTQAGFKDDGTVDGNNMTGQYQQLQKGQGMALEAQHNLDMSRGIGGVGISQQGTSNMRYGNDVAQANFGNAFQNAQMSLTGAGTDAFNNYQQSLMNLQLQSIADARATQNFPGAPGGAGGVGGDGGSSGGTLGVAGMSNLAYAATPAGKTAAKAVAAKPGSAGSSGAAQTLLAAAAKQIVPNYQAKKNTTNYRGY